MLALALGSCTRPSPSPQAQAADGGDGGPAESGSAAEARPLALRSGAPDAPRPTVVQAAASLAGHDRFLVLGDGPRIPAADFLIGALSASEEDERLAPFTLLRAGMAGQALDPKAFSPGIGRIATLVFGEAYAKATAVEELRLGLPRAADGGLALRFRLLGPELSALGEAILQSDADGNWLIEHFELDKDALSLPRQAIDAWEPPLALYP